MQFRVQLDVFNGPLDLLLHLVRKHEVDISNIPVAAVADQFLEHVSVLEQIDVDAVGDFLDLASTLIEIKSQMVLPRQEAEEPEELEDPRQELVERLLEFKKYRDASQHLEQRGREWQDRYARAANDLGSRQKHEEVPAIAGVELWDLVSAFGRVLRDKLAKPVATSITYDDTPIHVYMQRLDERLQREGSVTFFDLFPNAVHKSTLVGMFLAVLEMVRYRYALAHQAERYGDILIEPGPEKLPAQIKVSAVSESAD
ncbi:segregation and condensation protein A [Aeoliella mucimassa]|uniref:Segregation and condensation protein A n=1 Tax=Aeoliella mucimassa TaxID=2527972 RepID=A0A518AUX5_9BACT|nr:segregation/condensation protein A [Aeoliella mucimassa]QDU58525.1 Segregation and condensation protein A [Aeoliella mucimassa]